MIAFSIDLVLGGRYRTGKVVAGLGENAIEGMLCSMLPEYLGGAYGLVFGIERPRFRRGVMELAQQLQVHFADRLL